MALVRSDRVRETSTTTGTGTIDLDGAVTGFQTFVAGVGNGNTCTYLITDGTNWEIGTGTVTDASPDTLARSVEKSSNSDNLVNFPVGSKEVFAGAPASLLTKLDGIEDLADVTDAANVALAGAVMDSDISAGEGFLRKTGAGTYEAIKTNLNSAVAPDSTNDNTEGYSVGSLWINTTSKEAYRCVDASTAAAVWTNTTLEQSEITHDGGSW